MRVRTYVLTAAGALTLSFSLLAQRKQRFVPVFLYLFDILWIDGYDVRRVPLRSRKRLLRGCVGFADPVRLTPYRNERGEELFAEACGMGWEGLIAKRASSTYTERRSRDWLKFKCDQGQELVIAGYTDPQGARSRFGALLLGYYEGDELRYAGRVGTGFDDATLESLGRRLDALSVPASPFADPGSVEVSNTPRRTNVRQANESTGCVSLDIHHLSGSRMRR